MNKIKALEILDQMLITFPMALEANKKFQPFYEDYKEAVQVIKDHLK